MKSNTIGPLASSIVGKTMEPSVIQFGWDGGSLNSSLKKSFRSFSLSVVPEEDNEDEDEDGDSENIVFCDPDLVGNTPGENFDIAVIDPKFSNLALAIYISMEGVVSENGILMIPDGHRINRCRKLLHEMVKEGSIKCANGTPGKVRIYEIHNGKMVEML